MDEIRQYYKFRPDEIFRRITVTSLVTLMVEVNKLEYQEEDAKRLDNQIREDQENLQQDQKNNAKKADDDESVAGANNDANEDDNNSEEGSNE